MEERSLTEELKRLETRSLLETLNAYRGSVTSCVTLYVPPDRGFGDVTSRLAKEIVEADNVKNRVNRQSIVEALTTALHRVQSLKEFPPNGLALFSGAGVCISLEPPERVTAYLYHCGQGFDTEPLQAMLKPKRVYGLLVVDRKEASLGLLRGSTIDVIANFEGHSMGKHDAGGMSQHRYERQIEHAIREFNQKVSEAANRLFLPLFDDLSGILVGGPGASKDTFLKDVGLDYRLMKLVMTPSFNTGYTNEQGLKELVAAASPVLEAAGVRDTEKLLFSYFERISRAPPLAVYGAAESRLAVANGQADILILSEGLPVEDATELAKLAEANGTKAIFVPENSDLGHQFLLGFGGVGVLLRWT